MVLTAAAGARRTDSAYPRLLESANAADFLISVALDGLGSGFYDEVAGLPQVADAGTLAGINLVPTHDGPLAGEQSIFANAGVDGRFATTVDRSMLLAGRLPDPGRATEALANRELARVLGLTVATRFPCWHPPPLALSFSQAEPVTFTVVGIGLFPQEVVPGSLLDAQPELVLTPAYVDAHRSNELNYDGISVRLRPGADRDSFRRGVDQLAELHSQDVGEVFISDNTAFHAKTERAIRPQAVALVLFAVLAGGATLLVMGQSLSRLLSREALEYPALRALGMTRGQLVALHLSRAGAVALLAGLVAVGVALACSSLMPIGPARAAEPDPGFAADFFVLGPGLALLVVLLIAWVELPAWRAASAPAGVSDTTELPGRRRPSRLVRLAVGAGLPAAAITGIRMALEPGRGRTAVPVRSAPGGYGGSCCCGHHRRHLRHQSPASGHHSQPVRTRLGPGPRRRVRGRPPRCGRSRAGRRPGGDRLRRREVRRGLDQRAGRPGGGNRPPPGRRLPYAPRGPPGRAGRGDRAGLHLVAAPRTQRG